MALLSSVDSSRKSPTFIRVAIVATVHTEKIQTKPTYLHVPVKKKLT